MKKLIIALFAGVILAGCNTTVVTKPRLEPFNIPSELLDCKQKRKPAVPNYKTLVDKQVSKYVVELKKIIDRCGNDVGSIEQLTIEYNEAVRKFNEENNK